MTIPHPAIPDGEGREEELSLSRDHAPTAGFALEWQFHPNTPEPGRRIVALYDDGSGGQVFYTIDGGFIDGDGDERESIDDFWCWIYAPSGYRMWCETREDDPFTFPEAQPSSAKQVVGERSRDTLNLSRELHLDLCADASRRDGDALAAILSEARSAALGGAAWDLSERDAMLAVADRAEALLERLQAIIDWADFALANAQEFDSHGVRNLDGPVFDAARAAIAKAEGRQ